jgi:HSP20 family protein
MNTTCEVDKSCCETNAASEYAVCRPAVDLLESNDAWLLRAEMPGVNESRADVTLERQVLTISGTTEARDPEGYSRQYGEFRPRRYERSFRVPSEVDAAGIEASVEHGVLTVRIPKAPTVQPTKVTVKAGGQG